MNHYLSFTVAALCLSLVGCGGNNDSNRARSSTEASGAKLERETPEPTPAAIPQQEIFAGLRACDSAEACAALDRLVARGKQSSYVLAMLAVDDSEHTKLRLIALHGLIESRDPTHTLVLYDAALDEQDFAVRSAMFRAVAASGTGGDYQDMIAGYAADRRNQHRTELVFGVRLEGREQILAHATEHYPRKPSEQLAFAHLVYDTATTAAQVALVLEKTTDSWARRRLSAGMAKLGDASELVLLYQGLRSADLWDRSQSGALLAEVASVIPADRRAEVIQLARSARKADTGKPSSRGWNALLEKLGAQ